MFLGGCPERQPPRQQRKDWMSPPLRHRWGIWVLQKSVWLVHPIGRLLELHYTPQGIGVATWKRVESNNLPISRNSAKFDPVQEIPEKGKPRTAGMKEGLHRSGEKEEILPKRVVPNITFEVVRSHAILLAKG